MTATDPWAPAPVGLDGATVVLVMGKGGVGKTTLASATAFEVADRGARTLLVSTDAADSLEDVLDTRLAPEPVPVADRLDVVQLDARHELTRSWGAIADYLRCLLGATELDRVQADELVVVPGLDQLVALARLRSLAATGRWGALIVDCAPSVDSLRLLMLPDVLRWYLDRALPSAGVVGRWTWRRLERALNVSAPDAGVLDAVGAIGDEIDGLRAMLDRPNTLTRLVVTPERVVLAEAQRLHAYLALYDVQVDAVLVNRVPGVELEGDGLAPWVANQRIQLEAIDDAFSSLPRLRVTRKMDEPIGAERLRSVGGELWCGVDPLQRLATAPAFEIATSGGETIVRLPLPGVSREHVQLVHRGDEVTVTLGEHRRSFRLPDGLSSRPVLRAGLNGPHVEVVFGEVSNA